MTYIFISYKRKRFLVLHRIDSIHLPKCSFVVQFIWDDQRGDTGQTMRGRSGKALVAPVTGFVEKPSERCSAVWLRDGAGEAFD